LDVSLERQVILLSVTYLVVAGMHFEVSSHGDRTAEPEDSVEQVKTSWNEFVEGKILLEANGDEVEQRNHREDRYKHVVVDDGWIACKRHCDDVTHKGHHEESKEELLQC